MILPVRINLLDIPRRIAPIEIVKTAAPSWLRDRAPSMGAAIAYYTIFSLAPMLWLISAIVGLAFGESAARALESMIQRAELTKAVADWRKARRSKPRRSRVT